MRLKEKKNAEVQGQQSCKQADVAQQSVMTFRLFVVLNSRKTSEL